MSESKTPSKLQSKLQSKPHNFAYLIIVLTFSLSFGCADQHSESNDSALKNGYSEQINHGRYFNLYADEACQNPCSFLVKTDFNVAKVVYEADGYTFADSSDHEQGFEISYDFSRFGRRHVIAYGYSSDERLLEQAEVFVEVSANPESPANPQSQAQAQSPSIDVPYYYQYNNYYSPGASCQNTSIAMVLKYLGLNITPDDITARFGKDYAQSPAGLADVFNRYLREAGLSYRLTPNTNGSLQGLKDALDQGFPVIIHGYFTRPGHVLVVTGYDENGYYTNDPAGRWSQIFKGGYTGSQSATVGKNIYYDRSAFEAAVATSNGYNYLPLWFHILKAN